MKISEKLFDSKDLLISSPVRQILKNNEKLPLDIDKEDLKVIENGIDVLINKLEKPLNIVIMGEVKSGKSTFINTLAGGEVSPVDVDEATACIIEFYYSENQKGIIKRKQEESIKGTPKEIYDKLLFELGNKKFFSNIEIVKIGMNLPNLEKLHIIDTPGLATINEQNEKKTNDFIQESDVVLWVFNANFIGQTDVQDRLKDVAKLGKPIIGIINKIDQVEDKQRLIEYTEKTLGIYIENIFPLSASIAYSSLKNNDDIGYIKSGFTKILSYLQKTNKESDKIHDDSIIASLISLLRREVNFHESYYHNIEFIIGQSDNFSTKVEYYNNRIKNKIKILFQDWVSNDLLYNEQNEILNHIDSKSFLSKGDVQIIKNKLTQILSKKKLEGIINTKIADIQKIFKNEWEGSFEEIQYEIKTDAKKFEESEQIYIDEFYTKFESTTELIKEGLGKGAIIGGTLGIVQGALLAATAAFTMTVFFFAIPIGLAIGALTGGISKFLQFGKKKEALREEVNKNFHKFREEQIKCILIPKIMNKINNTSDKIKRDLIQKFNEKICSSWNKDRIKSLLKEIKLYVINQNTNLNKIN